MTAKRSALYIRVSHEEQAMNGYSLQAQENRLRQYALEHNYQIVECYRDEGISARSRPGRRKEFARMLQDVQAGRIDCILFIKLDRWFRNVSDFYTYQAILDKYNVVWETTEEDYNTNTAQGRLYLNIKLSIAQNESDTTSERINFVFVDKIKRGEVISGKLPLGYSIKDKHIVPDEKAPIIRDVFNYYLKTKSIRQTMIYLAEKHGIVRAYPTITQLLRNEKYMGRFYGIDNYAPPIISQDTFSAVQQELKRPRHHGASFSAKELSEPYLFKGLLRCPSCHHRLVGMRRRYKDKIYVYYQCPQSINHSDICGNKALYKEPQIEGALLVAIPQLIKTSAPYLSSSILQLYLQCHKDYQKWSLVGKYQYWHFLLKSVLLPAISSRSSNLLNPTATQKLNAKLLSALLKDSSLNDSKNNKLFTETNYVIPIENVQLNENYALKFSNN